MKNVVGLIALVLSAALVGGACDDNDDEVLVLNGSVDEFDVNGDLVVSQAEWNAGFAVWDVDNNGVLTASEFRLNNGAFQEADLNGDAVVTEAEWDAFLGNLDVNNDLFIDANEFDPFL